MEVRNTEMRRFHLHFSLTDSKLVNISVSEQCSM